MKLRRRGAEGEDDAAVASDLRESEDFRMSEASLFGHLLERFVRHELGRCLVSRKRCLFDA